MTTPVEQAAREAAEKFYRRSEAPYLLIKKYAYGLGYLSGHAAASAESETEIAALKQDCQTLEWSRAEEVAVRMSVEANNESLRAKLAAMREPLWMLREEHESEVAGLRGKLAEADGKLTEAKSAIRWMHGYDEPGTEAFPICPDGKRYAWRGVSRQQFAIVREACMEQLYPTLPEPKS